MAISSYLLSNGVNLYYKYEQHLSFIDKILKRKNVDIAEKGNAPMEAQVIINGYENIEGILLEKFMSSGKKVLVVDNDPDVIRKLRETKIDCIYGDLAEHDIFERINFEKAESIMSSVPNYHDNMFIIVMSFPYSFIIIYAI